MGTSVEERDQTRFWSNDAVRGVEGGLLGREASRGLSQVRARDRSTGRDKRAGSETAGQQEGKATVSGRDTTGRRRGRIRTPARSLQVRRPALGAGATRLWVEPLGKEAGRSGSI